MKLEEIVPWGRSFDEYRAMFALTGPDLSRSILGCGDGPAAFNAGLTGLGGTMVSVDPLYQFPAAAIARQIDETAPTIMDAVQENHGKYRWEDIPSPDALLATRRAAMNVFLADFQDAGGRYVAAALPQLPFQDGTFALALASHLLFTYSDHLDERFHVAAIREMLRLAPEVRIFPLITLDGSPSPHVAPVQETLAASGYRIGIECVPYEFQWGGNTMMRVRRPGP